MIIPRAPRFWRYFTLIALAHFLGVLTLLRWAHEPTNLETKNVVWLSSGGVGDGDTTRTGPQISTATPEPKQGEELEEERPILTSAKSDIQLPSATPKPTPKPKPSATSKPNPKPSPKSKPKPKPKALLAKASPQPRSKAKTAKSADERERVDPEKIAKDAADDGQATGSHSGKGKGTSSGAGGRNGGAGAESQFGWYGNMLHDRFHSAWIQPTTVAPAGEKISVLVKVRIEQDGSVSQFQVVKPSGIVIVDESVSAVAKRVTQVDPLPNGLGTAGHYDVRINFELKPE